MGFELSKKSWFPVSSADELLAHGAHAFALFGVSALLRAVSVGLARNKNGKDVG